MSELYPVIFGLAFILILSAVSIILLRVLNRSWWSHRWVRLLAFFIPAAGAVCIVVWAWGVASGGRHLTSLGATGSALAVVVEIALLLSLPISGVIHIASDIIRRVLHVTKRSPVRDDERRIVLKTVAAVFPVLAVSTGLTGVARSFADARIRLFSFGFRDLPETLDGMRILQISDVHLGYYVMLDDLERLVSEAEGYCPDLVLVTGDVSDDLGLLPDALNLIAGLKPPCGCYASLGNHEYYRGIAEVRRIFDKSPIPLLVNEGTLVPVNRAGHNSDTPSLYLAGADDPKWLGKDSSKFLHDTVKRSMADAPENTFKILMSHRPEGFDFASGMNVDLTLAGHTHGGQIGFEGRSLFERVLPYKYLWGHYKKNGSQLYTTSGVGHWFPFRMGCPPEAPLIELLRQPGPPTQ